MTKFCVLEFKMCWLEDILHPFLLFSCTHGSFQSITVTGHEILLFFFFSTAFSVLG